MTESSPTGTLVERIEQRHRRVPVEYRHLAGVTLGCTYVLMVLGAYTSAIGAGLACPDWPTCYGSWSPFLHPELVAGAPYTAGQILAEWAHRGLAMLTGLLILDTALSAWRSQRERPLVVWGTTLALLLLPVQVVIGGLTVTRTLQPYIVTTHLGVAILMLLSLQTTTVLAWYNGRSDAIGGGTD